MQVNAIQDLEATLGGHFLPCVSEGETGRLEGERKVKQTQRDGKRCRIRWAKGKKGGVVGVVVPDAFWGPRSYPS